MTLLSDDEISNRLDGLDHWSIDETADAPSITATYEFADFTGSIDFVNRVARQANQMDHHPDIDIRWDTVTLVLSTHSEHGLTDKDFELAKRINLESGEFA